MSFAGIDLLQMQILSESYAAELCTIANDASNLDRI